MTAKILAKVYRGGTVESKHRGWIAVCNNNGELISGTHKIYPKIFFRSSLKLVQALPFILSDGIKEFKLSQKELAILMSSHSGDKIHTDLVTSILKKINLNESDLKCGVHIPYSQIEANNLVKKNKNPNTLLCNCSGKHSGMLATCLINNWSIKDYYEYNHPLQKQIRLYLSELTNYPESDFEWAIDGCGVPTYALPLDKLAVIFANIENPEHISKKYNEPFKLIREAIISNPDLIAGNGRVDTDFMMALNKKGFSKIGGEAIFGFSIIGSNKGVSVKLEDGSNRSMLEVLKEVLKILGEDSYKNINKLKKNIIYNNNNDIVGEIKASFKLNDF